MKTIIKKFEEVGLNVQLESGLINIEQQDAKGLLKKFNLKTKDSIKVRTSYIKDSDLNVLIFSTDESESVVFNGIDFIITWYNSKSLLYKNWENSKTKIQESNPLVAQFRPTLVLDSIRQYLIGHNVITKAVLNPLVETRKEMILDNKFKVIYIYLNHSEKIEVSYLKQKDILRLALTEDNLLHITEEITNFIESKTKFRKILISKLKLGFFKKYKTEKNNK